MLEEISINSFLYTLCCSELSGLKFNLIFNPFQAAIFSKQLSIVLEPEAVSVICHHEAGKLVGLDLVKAGSQYMVVDAAGI